jgi:hypothetical protein
MVLKVIYCQQSLVIIRPNFHLAFLKYHSSTVCTAVVCLRHCGRTIHEATFAFNKFSKRSRVNKYPNPVSCRIKVSTCLRFSEPLWHRVFLRQAITFLNIWGRRPEDHVPSHANITIEKRIFTIRFLTTTPSGSHIYIGLLVS